MKKKHNLRGPIKKYEPKQLDESEYFALMDCLHDICLDGNTAALARILNVHRNTAKKMLTHPPALTWWTHILRLCLSDLHRQMTASVHKKIRKKAQKVRLVLNTFADDGWLRDIEADMTKNGYAMRLLLVLLRESPGREIEVSELKKPGVGEGVSMKSFRIARAQLDLPTETKGFGSDKRTWWRLPERDDLDNYFGPAIEELRHEDK